jgi:hypothetical protein
MVGHWSIAYSANSVALRETKTGLMFLMKHSTADFRLHHRQLKTTTPNVSYETFLTLETTMQKERYISILPALLTI